MKITKKCAVLEKYPWDKWMNGKVHEIQEGEDFSCSFQAMRVALHRAAGRRGGVCAVRKRGPGVLQFQFRNAQD